MRNWKTAALAGVAALALAAAPMLARADSPAGHVLTIHLPDGSVEQIHYAGATPPRVVLAPPGLFAPMAELPTAFGPQSPFAMLQRMSAQMDRTMAAMMHAAFTMPVLPFPGRLVPAGFGHAPFGSSYSVITTINGNNVCTRSVTITSRGADARPQVVSDVSGNCGHAGQALLPARQHLAPAPASAWRHGDLIRVKYDGGKVLPARPASWQG